MNLNDPFCRLSKKKLSEYANFKQQLIDNGIDNRDKAMQLLKQSRKQMLIYILIVVAISIGMTLFSPQLSGIILVFSILIVTWLLVTLSKGQTLLKLYIHEQFSGAADQP